MKQSLFWCSQNCHAKSKVVAELNGKHFLINLVHLLMCHAILRIANFKVAPYVCGYLLFVTIIVRRYCEKVSFYFIS